MDLIVERVNVWAASIRDEAGGLSQLLAGLRDAGADLDFVIAHGDVEGVIELIEELCILSIASVGAIEPDAGDALFGFFINQMFEVWHHVSWSLRKASTSALKTPGRSK